MFGKQAQAPKQYAVWQALPGSQSLFLSSPVREVCFAGSRGPGKTDAMLMSFAQYCGRGYGDYFRGVIFRRNYKHLDDIIAKSKRWFNKSAQQPRFLAGSSSLKWVWPTGEELLLRAFEDENDYWSYHGHEYCVEVGTLVKTPNGLVPIEQLKVGDEVITPGGIDHVTRTFAPKIKECVKADFYDADRRLIAQQVQSAEHRLLTTSQTQCTQLGKTPRIGSLECEQFDAPFGHAQEPLARTTQWHSYKSLLETDQGSPEVCVSQRGENSLGISDFRQLQVFLQSYIQTSRGEAVWLEALFHRLNEFCLPKSTQYYFLYKLSEQELNLLVKNALVLLGQLLQCEQPQLAQGLGALRENASAQHCLQKLQDYLGYYRSLQDCGDEQFLLAQVGVPTSIPLQDGAVVRAHAGLLLDGQGQIRTHSRCQAATFFPNPYEAGSEVPADQIGFVEVEMRPCGPRLTVDITVGKNKMYITNSGIVNSNCFIGWEELTSWPSINCYESMKSCNRSSFQPTARLPSIPRLIRSSTNPYGVGHSWVKNYFIDPAPYGKIIRDPDGGNQRVALFGSVRENPFLGEEYVKTLESITDANKRKAWLEGSWDITSGGMFDDLWSADKHIIKPFDIPHSWRITRSFDWGSSKPFSCGWWAVSDGTEATLKDGRKIAFPRKTVFRIGEWYGCEEGKPNTGLRLPAKVVAQGILIRETQMRIQNRVQPGPADSAIYAVTDEASIGQNMEAEGVFWTPADKRPGSRKNGWELMRDRMDAVAKAEDKPGMYVFDTCRDFIRTVPNIARDQRDPDDVDTDAEDHIADDARYMVLSADHVVHRVKISGA